MLTNGVNERMKRVVLDGCMLCDATPHNDNVEKEKKKRGGEKKKKKKREKNRRKKSRKERKKEKEKKRKKKEEKICVLSERLCDR